jgi:CheY-like chemotaxis protein
VRISGTHSDITERKRTEEAAQDADRAKSTFLANMSHEIRTPMNGVIGMVDILQQTALSNQQQRMLNTIASSSQTLLQILNDILDYSKIEAGKLAIECVPTSLQEVTQSVQQLMQSVARAKGLKLSTVISPQLPPGIYTDPTRLRQILLNLLGNAIKFSPDHATQAGQVSLVLEPGVLPNGQPAVLVQVRDQGLGMSPEVVARLFRPFSQADASTARQFGGTGLGLSISQQLAVLMGGHITVQSTLGQGSEFTAVLPLQEAPLDQVADTTVAGRVQLGRHAPSREEAVASGQLILVAEDNETNRDVLIQQLRLLGYFADVAEDGRAALALWRSGQYGLLLTDCHMPHMDGFALTQQIRMAEDPDKRLPIIAITANAMQGEARRCLDAGMSDYMSKPLRLQELGPMLAKWLPLSELASPELALPGQPARTVQGGELPVWNSGTLTELVGLNPVLHQHLLTKFLANAQQQVAAIVAAAAANNTAQVTQVAHILKSAAASVGALRLSDVCQSLETAGQDADAPRCSALAAGIQGEFAWVEQAIRGDTA